MQSLNSDLSKFKGIIVAMNACYRDDGEISVDRVRALARHYLNAGVKGLYLAGSTGEGILQSVEERKRVLQSVVEEVGDKLTVIAHIGAPATKDAVELAIHAESVGADAISAVPSIYYPLSSKGVEHHWQTIVDSTNLPFIMYHIPVTTGFHLDTELFTKMARQEKVIGVKVSSADTFEIQQFKEKGGKNFIVFNGTDEQYLAGRIMGAEAGIGGTYGVMPELFLKIERCITEGNMVEAQDWQFKVNEIIADLLSLSTLYGACKAILKMRGLDTGRPRMPISTVKEHEYPKIKKINEKILSYIEQST